MASIFKPTYTTTGTDGKRVAKKTGKWYGQYKDLLDRTQRVPLCTDKQASRRALGALVDALAKASANAPVRLDELPSMVREPFLKALQDAGHGDVQLHEVTRPLDDLVTEWHQSLLDKGNTPKHADLLRSRIKRLFQECSFQTFADIRASQVQSFIAKCRSDGLSAQTRNFYLSTVKQFCRWMVADRRAESNPVQHMQAESVQADRRHDRAAFSESQVRLLVEAAYSGPDWTWWEWQDEQQTRKTHFSVSGVERSLLYRLVVETGLRATEVRLLTVDAFDLDTERPSVRIRAATAKNRQERVLPLRRSLAADIREHLRTKLPKALAFTTPSSDRTAKMLRFDLRAAGIPSVTAEGKFKDFHALRHTFGTLLDQAGTHPKDTQTLMRHAHITTTMDRYVHTAPDDLYDALDALPEFRPEASGGDASPSKATGTTGPHA
ncbi:MAG: site-specific integrase [Planctomycetota bacterium]